MHEILIISGIESAKMTDQILEMPGHNVIL